MKRTHKQSHTTPEKEIAWAFFYGGLAVFTLLWFVIEHAD